MKELRAWCGGGRNEEALTAGYLFRNAAKYTSLVIAQRVIPFLRLFGLGLVP